ncbi:DUF3883 domain-containing protein [Jiulongibacter sp. NS-SX5]|uniref:DUF3883 domain-containing protein n=1 Tax=Jiulongibacter sp. NS-SX5 TaxID=3463854 RepID=UPI00405969CC
MERSIVESIYKEKAKNDSNSRDLANSLNILSKTVFGDVNRFLFELLQNADDSSIIGSDNKVEFRLYDNYLLFSHTGKHFDSNDVHGISRVGSRDSSKNEDNEKTGYKGIGFKSVFGSSDCVQIVSNKFRFKFDKNHHAWGAKSATFPWQVIPIWYETLPEELNGRIDYEQVNTIISIENKELIYSEILNVFDDCQIILFLRHISSISFYRDDEMVFEIHKEPTETNSNFNLIYNGDIKSTWYLSDFILTIPDEVKQSIKKLSEDECPVKLKSATKTKLSLACLVEENSLAKLQDTILYSYLPTKVELDFPYLINGDFLLNAERTQLLGNAWNEYLIGAIAWCQLDLFSQLSKTKYKYEVLNILKTKYTYAGNSFKTAFNSEYEKAIKEVRFIPDTTDNLVLASECLVDLIDYTLIFPEEHIFSIYPGGYRLANLGLKNRQTLSKICADSFGANNISQLTQVEPFKNFLQNSFKDAYAFMLFLRGLKQDVEFYKNLEFVLDYNNELCVPSSLYFPSKSSNLSISFAETPFINNALLKEILSSNDKETIEWLKSLDLTVATDIEVLRKAIFQLIRNDSITPENTIEITRFAFNLFAKGELTDNDYSNLRKIKLLTNNGMVLATDCFLPDYFNPALRLESLVPEHNYVEAKYVVTPDKIPKWKQFFIKIWVKENITVTKIDRIERKALVSKFNDTSNYLSWIDDNGFYDSIYYGYRLSGQHSVSNFRYFYFLNHLANMSFASLFWMHILKNWDSFSLNSPKTKYHTYRSTSEVPDYLSYYSCNFPSIPCLDSQCYKSNDVYAPRFKKIIKDKYPVANFQGHFLTKEQVVYLGLKNTILIDDCISLLIDVSSEPLTDDSKKQVFALYEEILKSYNEGNCPTEDMSSLSLLSINNSFQQISNLYYFNVKTLTPPVNSDSFIQLNDKISEENTLVFCKIFNITIVNDSDLAFVSEDVVSDDSLLNKLKEILGFLSVLVAHDTSNDIMKTYTSLNQRIEATSFYKAGNLALSYKTQSEVEIFSSEINSWFEDNSFYFRHNWESPLALYSLTKSLCSFLSIDNLERELALFLQIDSIEICDWLTSKGYVVPENFMIVEYSNPQPVNVVNEPEIEYDVEEDTSLVEEFIPETEADDANISNLVVEKIPDTYTPSTNNTKSYKSLKNDEVKINIGRWAEEYVNKYLFEQENVTSINWLNKDEEAYQPYDFIIEQDGKEVYIEVKGTPSPDKGEFYLSKGEWVLMFEKKTDYQIYRLYNVGKKDDLKMKIIPSPYTLVENGSILGQDSISVLI